MAHACNSCLADELEQELLQLECRRAHMSFCAEDDFEDDCLASLLDISPCDDLSPLPPADLTVICQPHQDLEDLMKDSICQQQHELHNCTALHNNTCQLRQAEQQDVDFDSLFQPPQEVQGLVKSSSLLSCGSVLKTSRSPSPSNVELSELARASQAALVQAAKNNRLAVSVFGQPSVPGAWAGCPVSAWCNCPQDHLGPCNTKATIPGMAAYAHLNDTHSDEDNMSGSPIVPDLEDTTACACADSQGSDKCSDNHHEDSTSSAQPGRGTWLKHESGCAAPPVPRLPHHTQQQLQQQQKQLPHQTQVPHKTQQTQYVPNRTQQTQPVQPALAQYSHPTTHGELHRDTNAFTGHNNPTPGVFGGFTAPPQPPPVYGGCNTCTTPRLCNSTQMCNASQLCSAGNLKQDSSSKLSCPPTTVTTVGGHNVQRIIIHKWPSSSRTGRPTGATRMSPSGDHAHAGSQVVTSGGYNAAGASDGMANHMAPPPPTIETSAQPNHDHNLRSRGALTTEHDSEPAPATNDDSPAPTIIGRKRSGGVSSMCGRLVPHPNGAACTHCGATVTPVWRAGPQGPKTLCNACGVRYMKVARRK